MAGARRRPLVFGAIFSGVGGAGGELWRRPDVPVDASVNIEWYIEQARQAEAAVFDFVFVVDSQYIEPTFQNNHLNRLEPLTLLSAVAARTERIGLVATVSTSYSEPWDIARRLMSLDHISGGRAGWNIVTSYDPGTSSNFGRDEHGGYDQRYDRAHEAIEVVHGLWDSYEDDAFATEKSAERFFDPSKLHALNHKGRFFRVAGPLNIARSLQGRPVLVQAGVSDTGRELNARVTDLAFSFAKDIPWALEFKNDVRARAERYGRDPDEISFIPALSVRIGDTPEHAAAKEQAALDKIDISADVRRLARQFPGADLLAYDLDEPFPDLGVPAVMRTFEEVVQRARAEGRTIRQVVRSLAYHHAHFFGTAEEVADEIQRWYDTGAADGFNVFIREPDEFALFTSRVLPILRNRGIARREYAGRTLREHLELPRPVNVHALSRTDSEVTTP